MKTEMEKIEIVLEACGIPFEVHTQLDFNTPRIAIPHADDVEISIVCNPISIGYTSGLVEMWDVTEEEVWGGLSCKEVLAHIVKKF